MFVSVCDKPPTDSSSPSNLFDTITSDSLNELLPSKNIKMEEILELIHNEFIESEDYYVFLRILEEEQENK